MTSKQTYQEIAFQSAGETIKGRLYPAYDGINARSPAIILAHGLGATIEMRLFAFAERFSQAGYTCIVFDYRYFGQSTGKPRGLIDSDRQFQDWLAAFEYTSRLDTVDTKRIGLFGTSFSGGHVIRVGAHLGTRVSAIISQCPFTDGIASSLTVGLQNLPSLLWLGIKDTVFGTDDDPVRVHLLGEPHEVALMNAADAKEGALRLLPEESKLMAIEEVPARLILSFPFMRPGAYFDKVKCPIFVAVCGDDTVAPPGPTLRSAIRAPKVTIKVFDKMGHFAPYVGQDFEMVMQDYIPFYRSNLS